ncbi:MAG: deoxynucleoside kinase [Bacteroidota bacterium]|nr:deoxynucleoside kinase [Bacteroidota bacterium]
MENIYRHIAIEGNIGAGKTTLSQLIAEKTRTRLVLEEFLTNPFLPEFYKNPSGNAFALEVSFLVERHRQLRAVFKEGGEQRYISDYFFDKCLVFARINLNKETLALYEALFHEFARDLRAPDLLIFLHSTPVRLRENIRKRGRSFESGIEQTYLEKLEESYRSYLHTYTVCPIIYIDVSENDLLEEQTTRDYLFGLIEKQWYPGMHRIEI